LVQERRGEQGVHPGREKVERSKVSSLVRRDQEGIFRQEKFSSFEGPLL